VSSTRDGTTSSPISHHGDQSAFDALPGAPFHIGRTADQAQQVRAVNHALRGRLAARQRVASPRHRFESGAGGVGAVRGRVRCVPGGAVDRCRGWSVRAAFEILLGGEDFDGDLASDMVVNARSDAEFVACQCFGSGSRVSTCSRWPTSSASSTLRRFRDDALTAMDAFRRGRPRHASSSSRAQPGFHSSDVELT